MSRSISILQSNYIPWKGYFDLIRSVDEFILFDHVQYTKNDWRNRNRIKTAKGSCWLTIPVVHHFGEAIQDTVVADRHWAADHWRTLARHYAAAPFFDAYAGKIEQLYLSLDTDRLSQINHRLITAVCKLLGIGTKITWSTDYELIPGRTERLISLCRQTNAARYLTGPSARDYIEPKMSREAGIELRFADYGNYPEYAQLYPPFDHAVTILDLLFHTGPEALRYMKLMLD
jgi:hypothetical protein